MCSKYSYKCKQFSKNELFKNKSILLIIIIIYNKDLEVNMRIRDSQACNSDSRRAQFIRSTSLAIQDSSSTFLLVQSEATSPQVKNPLAAVQPGIAGLSFDLFFPLHVELFNLPPGRVKNICFLAMDS